MARNANIVSFNDVKQASQYRRYLDGSSDERAANARAGYVYYDLSRFADSKREDYGEGWPEEYSYDAYEASDDSAKETKPSRLSRLGGLLRSAGSRDSGRQAHAERYDSEDYSQDWGPYGIDSRDAWAFDEESWDYGDQQDPEPAPSRTSRSKTARLSGAAASAREQRRSNRTKSRANKLFDRQYASKESVEQAEGAPRAALYEAQMGSSHRKAARMQRASEAGSSMAKFNPAGWFSNIRVSARQMKIATAALCVVLAVAFLYAPAQDYYKSLREYDRLAAEYQIVEERNDVLTQKNESLASNAGMEDAVREKYGYVVSGETAGVVTGLSDATVEEHRAATDVDANVLSSSVKAPEEWYTPYLDAFFGVS